MSLKKEHSPAPKAAARQAEATSSNVHPSAPSVGTAGWGTTADERRVLTAPAPPQEASQPEAEGAGDVRFTSYPQNEAAQNPAAQSQPEQGLRCADAMQRDCGWSVTGHSEDELLGYMRAHAREAHGKNEFTPEELRRARLSIRRKAA